MSDTDKIWMQMMVWTVIYAFIALSVLAIRSALDSQFYYQVALWRGTGPVAIWIVGIIVIFYVNLTRAPYLGGILPELIVWTTVFVCLFVLLPLFSVQARGALFVFGEFPPSAIWVVGTLVIVYRKLRICDSRALPSTQRKTGQSDTGK